MSLRDRQSGYSLVEMVVVLVLATLILGALFDVLARQQRFYRRLRDRSDNKTQLRQIVQFVPALLRATSTRDTLSGSPTGGDIYSWSETALDFRSTFGSSVLCWVTTTSPVKTVRIPPLDTVGTPVKNQLTAWLTAPVAGDSVLVYDPDANDVLARWRAYAIASINPVTGSAGCPTGAGNLLAANDSLKTSYEITFVASIPVGSTGLITTAAGVPIRFFRRTHLELAHGSDSAWYLQYFDCSPAYGTPGGCAALAPIAGPLRPYSATASQTGFRFAYYDSAGAVLTPGTSQPRQLARVNITARAQEGTSVGVFGGSVAPVVDSIRFTIGLRNRH